MYTHDTYLSPLTWRYGSPEMRALWSEQHKRLLTRRFWIALATAEHEAGLVSAEQLAESWWPIKKTSTWRVRRRSRRRFVTT